MARDEEWAGAVVHRTVNGSYLAGDLAEAERHGYALLRLVEFPWPGDALIAVFTRV